MLILNGCASKVWKWFHFGPIGVIGNVHTSQNQPHAATSGISSTNSIIPTLMILAEPTLLLHLCRNTDLYRMNEHSDVNLDLLCQR